MKTFVSYPEIPATERKALAVQAYRRSRPLRAIKFTAFLLPFFCYLAFSEEFARGASIPVRMLVGLAPALVLSLLIWEIWGRPKLRAEIERIKNA
jgi:hypothetical protein